MMVESLRVGGRRVEKVLPLLLRIASERNTTDYP